MVVWYGQYGIQNYTGGPHCGGPNSFHPGNSNVISSSDAPSSSGRLPEICTKLVGDGPLKIGCPHCVGKAKHIRLKRQALSVEVVIALPSTNTFFQMIDSELTCRISFRMLMWLMWLNGKCVPCSLQRPMPIIIFEWWTINHHRLWIIESYIHYWWNDMAKFCNRWLANLPIPTPQASGLRHGSKMSRAGLKCWSALDACPESAAPPGTREARIVPTL